MLQSLTITNVVLIRSLELLFPAGLTVISGETGAGKSILLESLNLILGQRADYGLVRQGTSQATVVAVFAPPSHHPIYAMLAEQSMEGDESIVLRRTLGADGKSRSFINDQPVSLQLMKSVGSCLLDIHGQFDHIWKPDDYRILLDQFGGHQPLLVRVREAFHALVEARQKLKVLEETIEAALAREDYLSHVLKELRDASPLPGEEEQLLEKRQQAMSSHKTIEALSDASHFFSSSHTSLLPQLLQVEKALKKAGDDNGTVVEAIERLNHVYMELCDIQAGLDGVLRQVDGGDSLDAIEERLYMLRGLARKHHVRPDELATLLESLTAESEALQHAEINMKHLKDQVTKLEDSYQQEAGLLSQARLKASKVLEKEVALELGALLLSQAKFSVDLASRSVAEGTVHGLEGVSFMVQTNPDTAWGALDRIASGGEQSRLMLALKLVLATYQTIPTFIFDEIDSGVGGATAHAMGNRLRALGESLQVIAITHSPQVAACAHQHWVVRKNHHQGETETRIIALDGEQRSCEIARMLSGSAITVEARAAATQLLQGASKI